MFKYYVYLLNFKNSNSIACEFKIVQSCSSSVRSKYKFKKKGLVKEREETAASSVSFICLHAYCSCYAYFL